ncbi:MAG TPA: DUF2797 domain-containing protein [Methylococcaceae bacterium]|nr:DUF2797 domain-containing protein [Methylococcaceae bacterium]
MQGRLEKMRVHNADWVQYDIVLNGEMRALNPLIGRIITLEHTGKLVCGHCGQFMKKSFNQGYCYPCFARLAQCDLCMVKPETCHYDAGTCREPHWAETFCFQPHFVYLANTSGLKVGITRHSQLPTRWIDQGAIQALPVFSVSSRRLSGQIEQLLASHVSDKTQWQRMLKHQVQALDLLSQRDRLLGLCSGELARLTHQHQGQIQFLSQAQMLELHYPLPMPPRKVTALNFDKTPCVSGVLEGIKGQYLIFEHGVLNVRKFAGYDIRFSVS